MTARTPLPPTYFGISVVLIAGLHFVYPMTQLINWPVRWFGLIVVGLGAWLTLWCDRLFKEYETEIKPYRTSSVLVREGPYRFSRHPMYAGMTLLLLGLALLMGSLVSFLPVIGFALCMRVVFIPVEEKMLRDKFGTDYNRYCRKVRRWI